MPELWRLRHHRWLERDLDHHVLDGGKVPRYLLHQEHQADQQTGKSSWPDWFLELHVLISNS